jgi:hypothetical protein
VFKREAVYSVRVKVHVSACVGLNKAIPAIAEEPHNPSLGTRARLFDDPAALGTILLQSPRDSLQDGMQRIIDRLSRFTGIQRLPGQSQNDMRFIGSLHMVRGFVYNHPGVQNVVMGHIEFV